MGQSAAGQWQEESNKRIEEAIVVRAGVERKGEGKSMWESKKVAKFLLLFIAVLKNTREVEENKIERKFVKVKKINEARPNVRP